MSNTIKIKIGFSKPKNKIVPFFSWAIRSVENTEYSHVYANWYSRGAKVNVYYHASGTSVHFLCDEVAKERLQVIHEYEIEIPRERYSKLIHFCMTNAGKSYGMKQVIGIGYSKLMCKINKIINKLFKTKLKERVANPFSDGRKSQVCSELIGALIEDVIDEETNLDLDIAGPRAIKELLDAAPWAKKIS